MRPTGSPKTPGSGRQKGSLNKTTADLKAMILKALDEAGGVKYLQRVAKRNPGAFLTLLGKVLPMTITGPDGKELPAFNVNVRFGGPEPVGQREPVEPPQPSSPGPLPLPAEPSQAPRPPWLN